MIATAREICVCGAIIRLEMSDVPIGYRLTEWRKEHRHEMNETRSVGEVSVTKPWDFAGGKDAT